MKDYDSLKDPCENRMSNIDLSDIKLTHKKISESSEKLSNLPKFSAQYQMAQEELNSEIYD